MGAMAAHAACNSKLGDSPPELAMRGAFAHDQRMVMWAGRAGTKLLASGRSFAVVLVSCISFFRAQTVGAQSLALPSSAASGVGAAVAQLQSAYDQKTTMNTAFQQRFWVKTHNQSMTRRGRVTFAKPGKMHWVYDGAGFKHVMSEGDVINLYNAQTHEAIAEPIDASPYNAFSFLTGASTLASDFSFALLSGQQGRFPCGYVLIGTPKLATAAFRKVFFYVTNADAQLRRVVIVDHQGDENQFDFVSL
jgi:outer membrane lipoprotein-sorting protein